MDGYLGHVQVFFFFFGPCCVAWGILVPWPVIELELPELKAQSVNLWTTREVPRFLLLPVMDQ